MTKAKLPPTDALAPGDLVNERYRVIEVVGRGGLATVYRADDESLGRTVALKVISGSLGDADDARRHEDEVRLIAGFDHPGLVTLFDFVPVNGGPAAMLVMQFVDGETLASRIARGPLSAELTAEIGTDIATALAHVHEAGVMHRDIKPANILLPATEGGAGGQSALLADFGIARLVDDAGITSTGMIVGTASYLSPEQAAGKPLGTSTDVYSLGLVLLEALTGTRAFSGSAAEALAARLAADPVIPAELGSEWSSLLGAMLRRDPTKRPVARAVAAQLLELSEPLAVGHTKVMPAAAEATTERLVPLAPTERLTPAVVAAAPKPRRPRRAVPLSRTLLGVGVALAAVLLLILVLRLPLIGPASLTPPSSTPRESASLAVAPVVYPAVEGDLGQLLLALQQSVANLESEEATDELQARVLDVTELAAAADYEEAKAALESLQRAVDQAQLSSAEREQILEASTDVREELDALLHPKPGNGNKPGKK